MPNDLIADPAAAVHWQFDTDADRIGWLCLDVAGSGVNVLSRAVLEELDGLLDTINAASPAGLIIYSGKNKGFIAGADINEFPKIRSEQEAYNLTRHGQRILQKLADLPFPSVAVIDGYALGGGLELALACDWRVGIDHEPPSLGLPEVKLGVHPGFGGTVRLTRLVGVRQAMPAMLTGKSLTPARAQHIGLLDRLIAKDEWRDVARQFAVRIRDARQPPLLDRLLTMGPVRGLVAGFLRKQTAQHADKNHYPAPFAMIDLWQRYGARGDVAYDAEARSFARLVATDTSRNLVRVYFLQERLKNTGSSDQPPARHVHVIGAGVMGGDIAAWCAVQGLTVTLQDREMQYIEPALERAEKLFRKRTGSEQTFEETRSRLVADVTGEGASSADVVIEAIFENRDAKMELYRKIEPRMGRDAILASNTSSIPLEELAPSLARPERLIGLHFFNPVAKLPLVEVVRAQGSGDEAFRSGLAFTRQIGKLPVPCRSHAGFLVNRILGPYMAEAMELLREGVPIASIDHAAVNFGMPVGPIELADSVGLDVAMHVAEVLKSVIGRPVAPELAEMVEAGKLGRKSGAGFYAYRDGRPVRQKAARGVPDPAIEQRLILSLLNEAAACLHEQIAGDADLIDAGVIFGTGFAPFRGGPLHYARKVGVDRIIKRLEQLASRHGDRFQPSPGWQHLAE